MVLAMSDPLRIVQRVADHPDHDPIAVLLAVVGAPIDLGQIRAVGQVADRLEDQPLFTRANSLTPRDFSLFPVVRS